ncbi:MAG TPA: dihydrofolate reductase family protein [Puia sp.]|nr:dihydrofolate reductase family protein [Puia sp.]
MRKLMMKMSMSADGFVGGPHGENDWVFKSSDESSKEWSVGQTREAGMIIMGRKSFEMLANYWPTASGPFAAPMNEIPKAVFSKNGYAGFVPPSNPSAAEASWAGARVFNGDLAEGIRELKAGQGNPIVAIGGAGFMRSLIATGLIDEYVLAIHPVALGAGLPIFTGLEIPLYLKLNDVKTFPGGIAVHHYSA